MKKNKEKNTTNLCFRYGMNCKFCPRNAKCDEEYDREKNTHKTKVRKK